MFIWNRESQWPSTSARPADFSRLGISMPSSFTKGSSSKSEYFKGRHRLEHWYRDNTLYFLTVRCTDRFPAFASESAKAVFWRQFEKYTTEYHFDTWICALLDNHYHAIGYLPRGSDLASMIRKIHGSTAKLVNDLLPTRLVPFWAEYFDGCLRDEAQYRRAYRYTLLQSRRHGICADYAGYQHTRVTMDLKKGLELARERRVFLRDVPYKRYQKSDKPAD
jgi:REP element-mobilizing transposase RayT